MGRMFCAEMTSGHINWSTLKAISAFITKNIFNVLLLFFSNGGRTLDMPYLG